MVTFDLESCAILKWDLRSGIKRKKREKEREKLDLGENKEELESVAMYRLHSASGIWNGKPHLLKGCLAHFKSSL